MSTSAVAAPGDRGWTKQFQRPTLRLISQGQFFAAVRAATAIGLAGNVKTNQSSSLTPI
ncbi:hypothetical protein ABMA59_28445 [Mesorhizobium sp. CN2-181]